MFFVKFELECDMSSDEFWQIWSPAGMFDGVIFIFQSYRKVLLPDLDGGTQFLGYFVPSM